MKIPAVSNFERVSGDGEEETYQIVWDAVTGADGYEKRTSAVTVSEFFFS